MVRVCVAVGVKVNVGVTLGVDVYVGVSVSVGDFVKVGVRGVSVGNVSSAIGRLAGAALTRLIAANPNKLPTSIIATKLRR